MPGINPGVSTNDTIGMLNASQNLINLDALSEEFISNTPAMWLGLFATTPTTLPSNLPNPITILGA